MKPKSWLVVSVVIVLMIGAGNLIGYWIFSRSKDAPAKTETTIDAETAARTLARDRRDKALEALRLEDYDTAIANLEAALELDPTMTELPKFIEVAKKLKTSAAETKEAAAVEPEKEVVAEAKVERVEPVKREPEKREVREARVKPKEREREPVRAVEAKAEVVRPSMLLVTTSPSKLLVEIDGKARDLTPARIELSPGVHHVRIIDGERAVLNKEIQLDAGEVFSLNETFAAPEEKAVKMAAVSPAEKMDGDGKLDLVGLIDRDSARDPKKEIVAKELTPPVNTTGLTPAPASQSPRVLVFLPGKLNSSFEGTLRSKMSGVDVRVVTRAAELKEMSKSGPVDAILASPSVLRQYGLRPQLTGVSAKEARYVAASFKAGMTKEQLAGANLAAVDELGKKETTELVARLLGTSKKLKLRRVPKLEDLVPSMQVKLADAIVVRDSELAEIKTKTQQQLHLVELTEKADPPAVGFVDGGRRAVIERAVRGLDEQARADLGVSRWAE